MKHTKTLIITLLWIAAVSTTPAVRADQSDSFQNFGSITDSASPSAATSDSFGAQDQSTTWRATPSQSDSFQTVGGSDVTGDDSTDSGGTEDEAGGGGPDQTSGGRRGSGTPSYPAATTAPIPMTGGTAPAAPAPVGRGELSSPVTREGAQPARPTQAIVERPQRPSQGELPISAPEETTHAITETAHPSAPLPVAEFQTPNQSTWRFCSGASAISCLTAGETAVFTRLAFIYRSTGLYASIPAFGAGEMTAAPFLAMRPGSIEIGALLPFIRKRKRKDSRSETASC